MALPDEFDTLVSLVNRAASPKDYDKLELRLTAFIKKDENKAIDRVFKKLTAESETAFSMYLETQGKGKNDFKTTADKREAMKNFFLSIPKDDFKKEIGDFIRADFKKADGSPSNAFVLYASFIYLRRFENTKLDNPEVLWNKELDRPSAFVARLYEQKQPAVAPGVKPKTTLDIAMDAFTAGDKKTFEATIKDNAKNVAVLSQIFITIYSSNIYHDERFQKVQGKDLAKLSPKNYDSDADKLKIVNATREFLALKPVSKLSGALDSVLLVNLYDMYVKKEVKTPTTPVQTTPELKRRAF